MILKYNSKNKESQLISPFNQVDIIIWIFNCLVKLFLQGQKLFIDLIQLKLLWKNWKVLKIGNIWEKMDWASHKLFKNKEFNIQQVQKPKKTGIKSIDKLKVMFWNMVSNLVLTLEWLSSNKSSKIQIQTKEEPWWKVSKLLVELFCQLIGMMSPRKIMKEKTDRPLQKANNGKKDKCDCQSKI